MYKQIDFPFYPLPTLDLMKLNKKKPLDLYNSINLIRLVYYSIKVEVPGSKKKKS